MPPGHPRPGLATPAALTVTSPTGAETRVRLERLPFRIGRLGANELVLRDSRISRHHAQILFESDRYIVEDLKSSYGLFVNGERVQRKALGNGDRLSFGFPDSYQLTFALEEPQPAAKPVLSESAALGGANLANLRAMLEVARALQHSLSTDEVLGAVVEAALTVTGCERGFLLLVDGDDLHIRVSRSKAGPLDPADLRVPTRFLLRALKQRKDFLSMSFEPAESGSEGERTVADLELRSVVCLPLVRIRTGSLQETTSFSPGENTLGLLYMDSRIAAADLSAGGRELLTTLALEASTVLENARLLEEQWAHQRMEQELRIAREIQESLLPRSYPASGWFRAAGSSVPSLQVGGDYLDLRQIDPACWATVVADVSGKGVGAALLASLLQGMFLVAPYTRLSMDEMMLRVNRFLNERTGGEQYATVFYCTVAESGMVRWVNAGHPPPVIVRAAGRLETLPANGLPVGLLEEAVYDVQEAQLSSGDKLVIYSDGLSEARNANGEFLGFKAVRELLLALPGAGCRELQQVLLAAVERFTGGAPQEDDISLLVLEYH